jgi:hypothetical protein
MNRLIIMFLLVGLIGCSSINHYNVDKNSIEWDRLRVKKIYATYDTKIHKDLAKDFKIKVGMSKELLILSIGEPTCIRYYEDKNFNIQQYRYFHLEVWVKNDKIVKIIR